MRNSLSETSSSFTSCWTNTLLFVLVDFTIYKVIWRIRILTRAQKKKKELMNLTSQAPYKIEMLSRNFVKLLCSPLLYAVFNFSNTHETTKAAFPYRNLFCQLLDSSAAQEHFWVFSGMKVVPVPTWNGNITACQLTSESFSCRVALRTKSIEEVRHKSFGSEISLNRVSRKRIKIIPRWWVLTTDIGKIKFNF